MMDSVEREVALARKKALKGLIYSHGLAAVVDTLAVIASDKADELRRATWRDEVSARVWEQAARKLSILAVSFLETGEEKF